MKKVNREALSTSGWSSKSVSIYITALRPVLFSEVALIVSLSLSFASWNDVLLITWIGCNHFWDLFMKWKSSQIQIISPYVSGVATFSDNFRDQMWLWFHDLCVRIIEPTTTFSYIGLKIQTITVWYQDFNSYFRGKKTNNNNTYTHHALTLVSFNIHMAWLKSQRCSLCVGHS